MDIKDLKIKSKTEIIEELKKLQDKLQSERFGGSGVSDVKKTHMRKQLRRDIARVKTLLASRS